MGFIDAIEMDKLKASDEFGLVTKVSEEMMLTVRWYKKKDEQKGNYEFQGEEIISKYESIKHNMFRLEIFIIF